MDGLNLTKAKFVYVKNKNRFGDVQGIFFELQKDWDWVQEESINKIKSHDFCDLIKNVCDLRMVKVNGLPIDMSDIKIAIESMKEKKESHLDNSVYTINENGFLVHNRTGDLYISAYGCSCILTVNEEAKRPQKRGYRNGITASKDIIRSMTPYGYWKTSKITDSAKIYCDEHALYECANDFIVEGNHHKVKGYIPTEVFQIARNIDFVFEIEEE